MYKLVMFDLDGTLADTLPLCCEAFRRAGLATAGTAPTDEAIAAAFGPSEEGMAARLFPGHAEAALAAYLEFYRDLHGMCPAPFPWARETLDLLGRHGVPLALITGKGPVSAAVSLERFGLARCFAWIATGAADGSHKEEHMREFTRARGVDPGEAVYVGDSLADIREAKAAGVRAFAAAWAGSARLADLRREKPDKLFTSLEDLYLFFQRELLHHVAREGASS